MSLTRNYTVNIDFEVKALNFVKKDYQIDIEYIDDLDELKSEIFSEFQDELKEIAESIIEKNREEDEDFELDIDEDSIEITTTDLNIDIHNSYANINDIWEYKEVVANSSHDEDVFDAGLSCGLSLNNIESSYEGSYKSDEDYAKQKAEETDEIPEHLWIYIDWKKYTRDHTMDVSDHDGHYFRM